MLNVHNKEKFQRKYLATTDGFSKQKSEGALLVKVIALTSAQYWLKPWGLKIAATDNILTIPDNSYQNRFI